MKQILSLCLFVLLVLNVKGQSPNIDSLVNVLNTKELTDDEKINIYWTVSQFYLNYDYDECILYANKALLLAEKLGNKRGLATFNNLSGIAYYKKASFDTSYVHLSRYLEWAIKLDDRELIASAYSSLASMYKQQENYPTAMDYYMKSLAINDAVNRNRAIILTNLGTLHRALNHWDRAEEHLSEALEIAYKLDLKDIEMGANYTLGIIYSDKQDVGKAIEAFKKSLEISREINDIWYTLSSIQALATSYSDKQEFELALEYASEGLQIAEKSGNTPFLLASWLTLAEIYRKLKRYEDCQEMASKAWAVDSTSLNEGGHAALNLAISNIHVGNKQKAEEFILNYQDILFKANNKQMNESLASMEVKYETEKKELRIASLEKQRRLYIWLGVAGIMFTLLLGVVLWLKIRNSQKEKQLVASNAVQEGEMGERERIAGELHDRLLGSLSALKSEIDNTNVGNKLNECIEEIRRISRDLMPLPLRNGIKTALEDFTAQFSHVRFHFFGQEKRVEKRLEFVLYCCANELVTNAIRHSGAKNIHVQLVQGENHIALTVHDDGCGFDEKTVIKGIGLQSVQDRVASCSGKMNIFSSPNKGTETVIEINI